VEIDMAMLGKYSIRCSGQQLKSGRFTGTAAVVWDEADATIEKLWHFHKEFNTEAEAMTYALQQAEVRYRDSTL
jgi:hypothetical protein